MLKSTHKPSKPSLNPLPAGWTEHKAPTGHSYYYNAETKQSTYTQPVAPQPTPAPVNPSESFLQYQAVGSSIPRAGPAFNSFTPQFPGRGGFQGDRGRGGHEGRGGSDRRDTRPQPVDKPKSRHAIPGCAPWVLVYTKYGRRFVYNTEKDQSFWRIPDKLKDGILELDQLRIKQKAEALSKKDEPQAGASGAPGAEEMRNVSAEDKGEAAVSEEAEDSSEYEEVEVTDDEDDDNPSKRQRTGDIQDEPVEFNEDDIAFQLAAMGQEYGLDPGEYDDGHMEDWEEGAEGLELSDEDSRALFKDLLDESGVNPYNPWETLVEEGKLVDDTRYTALTSMKARKEVWEEWSREKIKLLREKRAKEEKKDPRIPYLAFLQKHATPKLYWPEFKRKYKKESEMHNTLLTDKDREKFYRDHISRLKLPQSTLKFDLSSLLKSQPSSLLNNATLPSDLPPSVLADIRYISLDPSVRDQLVEVFITTLPPPSENTDGEETEEAAKERIDRERRNKALEERARHVASEKRRQQKNLDMANAATPSEEPSDAMQFIQTGQINVDPMGFEWISSPYPLYTGGLPSNTLDRLVINAAVKVPGGQPTCKQAVHGASPKLIPSLSMPPGATVGGFSNWSATPENGGPSYTLITYGGCKDPVDPKTPSSARSLALPDERTGSVQVFVTTPYFHRSDCVALDGMLYHEYSATEFIAWQYE
ncbi:hypothetical protein B7494_g7976 [Chlorociboria aeruginascens]|nr:hypothetical protein B7494_g7976 [Chlorociboria aeruginascens]